MRIGDGGVGLHVAIDGRPDAPPVVLLHGITSSVRTWGWLVPRLSTSYRVLRLDFRGHGGSDRAPGAYGPVDYLADAVAVCEQLAGRPAIVIGHSLGGMTAAALAQRHPALVRAVVLEDPPLVPRVEHDGHSLLEAFRLLRESVPRVQAAGMPESALVEVLRAAPSPVGRPFRELLHDDAIAAMAGSMLQLDAAVLDPVLTPGAMKPVFRLDDGLPVPAVLVTADPSSPDAVADPADAERLATVSAAVRVEVVAGAGHLLHDELDHRDAFWSIVDEFVGSLA